MTTDTLTQKKTLVLGASMKPSRYSYIAINRLRNNDVPVVAIGLREGTIADVDILTGQPALDDIHTVTLYMNPQRQAEWIDYIIGLAPERIIYNPGTENPDLMRRAREAGIQNEVACTLVMLASSVY